jgi:hypothetical protein
VVGGRDVAIGDEREPAFGIVSLAQMSGIFDQNDLEVGPHAPFQQMASDGTPVAATEHAMNMQGKLAIRSRGDIAGERCDFHLLVERVAQIILALPIEIAERRAAEGADGAELRGIEPLFRDELLEAGHDLVPALEHDRECPLAGRAVDQSRSHGMKPHETRCCPFWNRAGIL